MRWWKKKVQMHATAHHVTLCALRTPCRAAQVVLVSATLPHEVLEMTHKFMTDPVRILVKRDELTLEVGGCWVFCLVEYGARQGPK